MIEAKGLGIRVTGDGAEILGELFGVIIAARMELYGKADRKLMDAVLENVLRDALDAEIGGPEDPEPKQETPKKKPGRKPGRPRKEATIAGLDESNT